MEQLKLPVSLVNKGDVLRLMREVNALDDFFVGAAARQPGQSIQPPKTSRVLEQLAADNARNLFEEQQRQKLYKELEDLSARAPSLHISFASEPSPRALEPLLRWMRDNLHPQVLLSVGFQPAIAAGCVLRTPNKIFDMSIGAHLEKQAPLLMKLLAGSIDGR
jgi:F0F1-type ATP synthase delta subunit